MKVGDNLSWGVIKTAWASVAMLAVTTMQDVLSLGSEARMNMPGTVFGNWEWRFKEGDIEKGTAEKLKKLTKLYGRA